MLIRNNSPDQINLGFVNHVIRLEPGEIAEVEELIVEEPSFQNLENLGVLEILSYEVDPTRLAVRQELDDVLGDHEVRITALESATSAVASQEYPLLYWGLEGSITNPVPHEVEFVTNLPMRFDGFLTRAYVRITAPRTNGAISIKPKKNGVVIGDASLHLNIGLANPQEQTIVIAVGNVAYQFFTGDTLGAEISSSSFAPVGENVHVSYVLTQV